MLMIPPEKKLADNSDIPAVILAYGKQFEGGEGTEAKDGLGNSMFDQFCLFLAERLISAVQSGDKVTVAKVLKAIGELKEYD